MVAVNSPSLSSIFPCPKGYREIRRDDPPPVGTMLLDRSTRYDNNGDEIDPANGSFVKFLGFEDDGWTIKVCRGELEWTEKYNWYVYK